MIERFSYLALDAQGNKCRGILSAENTHQAKNLLAQQGLIPLKIALRRSQSQPITAQQRYLFLQTLATLLNAQMNVVDAIQAMLSQTENNRMRAWLASLLEGLQSGYALSQVIARTHAGFDAPTLAMLQAGELSGQLPTLLTVVVNNVEKQKALRDKLLSSMIYPAVMLLVALAIVTTLLITVVPTLINSIDDVGGQLPALTQGLLTVSQWLQTQGWLIPIVGLLLWAWFKLLKKPVPFLHSDLYYRIPVLGPLWKMAMVCQFSLNLGMLLEAHVPLVEALNVATGGLHNLYYRKQLSTATASVQAGQSLTQALKLTQLYTSLQLQLLANGEQTAQCGSMLLKIAEMTTETLSRRWFMISRLFEPALIIVVGLMVLLIVLAIMLPIFDMNTLF